MKERVRLRQILPEHLTSRSAAVRHGLLGNGRRLCQALLKAQFDAAGRTILSAGRPKYFSWRGLRLPRTRLSRIVVETEPLMYEGRCQIHTKPQSEGWCQVELTQKAK